MGPSIAMRAVVDKEAEEAEEADEELGAER
jgi:hypothetical protein